MGNNMKWERKAKDILDFSGRAWLAKEPRKINGLASKVWVT